MFILRQNSLKGICLILPPLFRDVLKLNKNLCNTIIGFSSTPLHNFGYFIIVFPEVVFLIPVAQIKLHHPELSLDLYKYCKFISLCGSKLHLNENRTW